MFLPKIYQNKNNIRSNNQIEYKIDNKESNNTNTDTNINNIFNTNSIITKIDVEITLNDNSIINTCIIGKTNKYLVTKDNKLISINQIKNIQKK